MKNWLFLAVLLRSLSAAAADEEAPFRFGLPIEPVPLVSINVDDLHSCTGFIAKDGYIITAGHCLGLSHKQIKVLLYDGTVEEFTLVKKSYIQGNFSYPDWAILKGNTHSLHPAPLSTEPAVIPSPGFIFTAKDGDRTAIPLAITESDQLLGGGTRITLIADVRPGDSGSPIINYKGEVVGVFTSYYTDFSKHQGWGWDLQCFIKELP